MKRTLWYMLAITVLSITACDSRSGRVKYLVGDDSLRAYFSLDARSVTIYASPEDKKEGRIECRLYDDESEVFARMFRVLDDDAIEKAYREKGSSRFSPAFIKKIISADDAEFRPAGDPARPLEGLRVAIDPGHSADTMEEAVREGKYILLFTPEGEKLSFYEAALNLATAMMLKEMLERDGATVMLTRTRGGQVYPVPYDTWVKKSFRRAVREKERDGFITPAAAKRLLTRSSDRLRLKFFNSEFEMPHRAMLINRFRPHVTVLAHYDARDATPDYRTKYRLIKNIARSRGNTSERMKRINEVVDSISAL
ncbi:MAG: N-acetylmuramoyl-L-alanine amidase, partial [Deltaproteobacteria bacterium]|nr:N-acetylmuramoyl-L-alanine amidase [Candidatus Zymogenaceae bacterium]